MDTKTSHHLHILTQLTEKHAERLNFVLYSHRKERDNERKRASEEKEEMIHYCRFHLSLYHGCSLTEGVLLIPAVYLL